MALSAPKKTKLYSFTLYLLVAGRIDGVWIDLSGFTIPAEIPSSAIQTPPGKLCAQIDEVEYYQTREIETNVLESGSSEALQIYGEMSIDAVKDSFLTSEWENSRIVLGG